MSAENILSERIHELAQRVASLERGERSTLEKLEDIEETVTATNTKIDAVTTSVANLVGKIAKWEGKFGGVFFIVGCIWTFLVAAWGSIFAFIKQQLGLVGAATGGG